jgi:hypothetical protein
LLPKTATLLNGQKDIRRIVTGSFVLPAGIETAVVIFSDILEYCDILSLLKLKESSLVQQLGKSFESDDFERIRDEALEIEYEGCKSINEMILTTFEKKVYLLRHEYREEFPLFYPPLIVAVKKNKIHLVRYLIEKRHNDPNIAIFPNAKIALHSAINNLLREPNAIDLIKYLIKKTSINSINHIYDNYGTILDCAYDVKSMSTAPYLFDNEHPAPNPFELMRIPINERPPPPPPPNTIGFQEIITLLRLKGGISPLHDENGRRIRWNEYDDNGRRIRWNNELLSIR